MTREEINVNNIIKHLEIIEKEASQIGNYSGEYNHKVNILKSITELEKILGINED